MSLDGLILWLQRGADRGFPGAALELSGHPGWGLFLLGPRVTRYASIEAGTLHPPTVSLPSSRLTRPSQLYSHFMAYREERW